MAVPQVPVDTGVKVPAAVARASARASRIHNATYKSGEPEIPVVPTEPAATPTTVVEAAPAAPAAPAQEPVAPVAPVAPAPAPPVVDWEHRFQSMKGRWEASEARASNLEQTIASLAVQQEPTPLPTSGLTAQEIADYGPDFVGIVERAAEAKLAPIVADLKKQVEQLNGRVQTVGDSVVQDKRAEMNRDLTTALPNWLEVNVDPKFLKWLDLPDTYSGAIRIELLKAAYAANDTRRVLAFFQGFLAEEAALAPPAPEPGLPTPPVAPQITLESLAAPGRAKTAATPPGPAEKPSFTRAQVTAFYTACAAGHYRGKEEEKNRLEQQIHEAGQQGRIR